MPLREIALGVAIMMVWGANFGIGKNGLTELSPLFLLSLRMLLVAVILVPFTRLPPGRWRAVLGLSIVLGGLHWPMMFKALDLLGAGLTAIIVQTQVPFAAILAWFFLGETLTARKGVGMVIAFAGVAVLSAGPEMAANALGLVLALVGSFLFAVANLQMKALKDVNGFALNGWMSLMVAPQLIGLSYLLEDGHRAQIDTMIAGGLTSPGVIAVLYMSIMVTIVGFGLWYGFLGRHPVNRTVPFTLLIPVFGALSGIIVVGEEVTLRLLVGGAVTIAGVALIVIEPRAVALLAPGTAKPEPART